MGSHKMHRRLGVYTRHLRAPAIAAHPSRAFSTKPVLTGHYAALTGICAEQAERAFRNEVTAKSEDGYAIATFAGGCFWGPQLLFDRIPGVVATSVGYCQGHTEAPDYYSTCRGDTGYTEAVQVFYD